MLGYISALLLMIVSPFVSAQFPPKPTGLSYVTSKVDSSVTISYKEAEICEKTPGVKSYSGFVHLPGSILGEFGGYDMNTYFIYFQARNNASTAPLAIYLAGGPGESSTFAAMSSESGPCYVNVDGTDTVNNIWSFNENVNMLYIDQPVDTGFSYQTLINATYDNYDQNGWITPTNFDKQGLPKVNATIGYGTFPDQSFTQTVNTTVQAAKALWLFAENWLSSFPEYTTESNKLNVWGNSYGGYWVPETSALFLKNLKALPVEHPLSSKAITIDNIGITNGCMDFGTSVIGYPEQAYNNTYGHPFGSEALYEEVLHNVTKSGGCLDLVNECRALGEEGDPNYSGTNATVNELCEEALGFCDLYVALSWPKLNERNPFDLAQFSQPCAWYAPVSKYLNTASVQQALGVPLNFTYDSNVVATTFGLQNLPRAITKVTGDSARQNGLPNLEYLLANNVKIALMFGDRDYRCPWTGGESTALAVKWANQAGFSKAGYQELEGLVSLPSEGSNGAVTKQYGQLSFTRVFQSGHSLSAYAPEIVYRIFDRTMNGLDVVSGTQSIKDGYHTTGPTTAWQWQENGLPTVRETCMVEGKFVKVDVWSPGRLEGGN